MQPSLLAQCTVNDATDCQCLDPNQTDCDLLPDIQLSWYGLIEVSNGPTEYPQSGAGENSGRLRISVSTPNDGVGPLTVRGVDDNGNSWYVCGNDTIVSENPVNLQDFYCDNGEEAKLITWQRIYHRNSDGTMSYYDRMAGTMTYHPDHNHNHSDDWGVFTLRIMDPNDPDPLNWPIVSDGAKMGFCLMDYGTCGTGEGSTYYGHCRDENRYSADYLNFFPEFNDGTNGGTIKYNSDFPNFGLGGGEYGCSQVEQGISSGWLDLYGEWLEDQWINLEPGLCNGVYWIVGEVDRNNNYLESNEDNNWSAVPVTLTQQEDVGAGGYLIELANNTITICPGGSTTLSVDPALIETDYVWSTGETSPSIEVSEAGQYSVITTNDCWPGLQSQIVTVEVAEISPVEIFSQEYTACDNETIEITPVLSGGSGDYSYMWADSWSGSSYEFSFNPNNGETQSVELQVIDNCSGEAYNFSIPVQANTISAPITDTEITIMEGESVTLNANSEDNSIIWQNSNGDILSSENTFVSELLYENTVLYVSAQNWLSEPIDNANVGASTHEGNSDYSSSVYNGGLLFDSYSDFILNNVTVYTDYPGERVIELRDADNNLINDLNIYVPETNDSGYIIELNWEVPEGSGYLLTTNTDINNINFGDNNPMFKRTTDDLPNYPYTMENILSINEGYYYSGSSTSYYYYFYNWTISSEGKLCGTSEPTEVEIIVTPIIIGCMDEIACNYNAEANTEDNSCEYPADFYDCNGICINDLDNDTICDELDNCPNISNTNQEDFNDDGIGDACDGLNITEVESYLFTLFPNPTSDILNITFKDKLNNAQIILFNNIGEIVQEIYIGDVLSKQKISTSVLDLPSGVYTIQCLAKEHALKTSFTISK